MRDDTPSPLTVFFHKAPGQFFGRLTGRLCNGGESSVPTENFRKTVFPFGQFGLILYLAFLNAFVPLSMDLYLPALPHMAKVFNCSRALSELTVSMFMLFFGLSMLVWGTLSDKYGRKRILLFGLGLYFCATLICIFSPAISVLIMGRILQAVGSGAISSISMAIVKDIFKGRIMESVLIWIQTITVLAPLIAPVLGAFLLGFLPWRGLFVVLLLCSVAAIVFSFFLKETLQSPTEGSGLHSFTRIPAVLANKGFLRLLLLFSVSAMPFMAYLTSSSFIYIRFYGLSEQAFSFFFAANASCSILGPLLYVRILRELNRRVFIAASFSVMAASGVLLLFFGSSGPFYFLVIYAPITIFGTALRPVATVLMMSQQDRDNGAVASLIGSASLLFGSFSMVICSLGWTNPILPVGSIALLAGAVCALCWLYVDSRGLYRDSAQTGQRSLSGAQKEGAGRTRLKGR